MARCAALLAALKRSTLDLHLCVDAYGHADHYGFQLHSSCAEQTARKGIHVATRSSMNIAKCVAQHTHALRISANTPRVSPDRFNHLLFTSARLASLIQTHSAQLPHPLEPQVAA